VFAHFEVALLDFLVARIAFALIVLETFFIFFFAIEVSQINAGEYKVEVVLQSVGLKHLVFLD